MILPMYNLFCQCEQMQKIMRMFLLQIAMIKLLKIPASIQNILKAIDNIKQTFNVFYFSTNSHCDELNLKCFLHVSYMFLPVPVPR